MRDMCGRAQPLHLARSGSVHVPHELHEGIVSDLPIEELRAALVDPEAFLDRYGWSRLSI